MNNLEFGHNPGERKNALKFSSFSLLLILSLSPPETLSSFSPPVSSLLRQLHRPARVPKRSPDHQLPTPNHQCRRTASETSGSAARNRTNRHFRGKLRPPSHRADLPSAHPHLLELQVTSIWAGGRARSSDRRPRAAHALASSCATLTPRRSCQPPGVASLSLGEA